LREWAISDVTALNQLHEVPCWNSWLLVWGVGDLGVLALFSWELLGDARGIDVHSLRKWFNFNN